jgi:hypothetical protein
MIKTLDKLWFKYKYVLLSIVVTLTLLNLMGSWLFKIPITGVDIAFTAIAFHLVIVGLTYKEKEDVR